jgi:hypothetical protein
MDVTKRDNKRQRLIAAVLCNISTCNTSPKYIVVDPLPNHCDAIYDKVLERIRKMKHGNQPFFPECIISHLHHLIKYCLSLSRNYSILREQPNIFCTTINQAVPGFTFTCRRFMFRPFCWL